MKKIACCSTLNDTYFEGFVTFFYSLLKHNPSFNYPYYILTWGQLSEENIKILTSMYPNFFIKNIANEDYTKCQYSTVWRTWTINCNNRFDVFTLNEFDKVVFLDADMLCLGDIQYLFDCDVRFGACLSQKGTEIDHPGKYDKTIRSFNGGLMVISRDYLNQKTKQELIDISLQKKWSSDEPILNVYFDNAKTTFLPKIYNTLSSEITLENLPTLKIVHFIGQKKPWFGTVYKDRYDKFVLDCIQNSITILRLDSLYQDYRKAAWKCIQS
jgi:lipopolysaccharide biosynthesis glycosyltransferase